MEIKKAKTTKPVEVETEEVVEVKEVKKPAKTKPVVKQYADTEYISCRSITAGELLIVGKKTGILYKWDGLNDERGIEYQDLLSLATSRSSHLTTPRIIIEDEELLQTPRFKHLQEVYDNLYGIDDFEQILKIGNMTTFKQTVGKLPKGVQDSFKVTVGTKIQQGSLDSLKKIKAIDEVLNTEFITFIQ